MMFKSKLATLMSAIIFTGVAFAAKPMQCPSLASIKAEGLTYAEEIYEGLYLDYSMSNYDTETNWFFLMGPIRADSTENAITEGNKVLATLSGTATPETDEEGDIVCEYNSGNAELGVYAVHPEAALSPSKMTRILRQGR
ncbi:MAG: DUF4949 domain-containing protein [Legionella sp.]|nr:MAG: DUF4949 domain-containing protein [Legionella sp.]